MPAEAAVAEASLALRSAMARIGEEIDAAFETVLALPDDPRARLYRAMRHAPISGGKRLRPLPVTPAPALYAADRAAPGRVGRRITCGRVYSRLHADLPRSEAADHQQQPRGRQ